MHIIVFGSTGASGKQIVQQALDAGHIVTAVARNSSALTISHANLTVVKGDVLRPQTFIHAVQNQDAVLSALGSRDNKPTVMFSEGMQHIIQAMEKYGVKRIECISASAVETNPKLNFFVRTITKILQRILKNPYSDILKMEQLLKQTNLDWTIVRPPRLTNGALRNKVRFAVNDWLAGCTVISRADLAHFMLQHINNNSTYQTTIEAAY
jgi:putative NADH-flavin reductase